MDCTICIAKTKALISCAVTVHLICVFVFENAKSRFSHKAAQFMFFPLQPSADKVQEIREVTRIERIGKTSGASCSKHC